MYKPKPLAEAKPNTCIAAFVPKAMDPEARVRWFDSQLPGKDCFGSVMDYEKAFEKLTSMASTQEADEVYLPWLRRGGKIVFETTDTGEMAVLEVGADGKLKELRKAANFEMPATRK